MTNPAEPADAASLVLACKVMKQDLKSRCPSELLSNLYA